jgi:hypothetical protein
VVGGELVAERAELRRVDARHGGCVGWVEELERVHCTHPVIA